MILLWLRVVLARACTIKGALLFFDARNGRIVPEIHIPVQQNIERRIGQRSAVHRVEAGILDIDIAVGRHDQDRAGRIVREAQLAGPGEIEFALRQIAFRTELDEIAFQRVDGIEIGAELVENGGSALRYRCRDKRAARVAAPSNLMAASAARMARRRMIGLRLLCRSTKPFHLRPRNRFSEAR